MAIVTVGIDLARGCGIGGAQRHIAPKARARLAGPDVRSRPHAVWRRRVAQGWADQGPRLFERSEFERDPDQTEQRSVPVAQRRDDDFGWPFLW